MLCVKLENEKANATSDSKLGGIQFGITEIIPSERDDRVEHLRVMTSISKLGWKLNEEGM